MFRYKVSYLEGGRTVEESGLVSAKDYASAMSALVEEYGEELIIVAGLLALATDVMSDDDIRTELIQTEDFVAFDVDGV